MNPEREDAVEDEREWTISVGPRVFGGMGQAQGGNECNGEVVVPRATLLAAQRRAEAAVEKAQARARASRESYRVTLCRAEKAESDRKWMLAALERLTDARWPDRRNCPPGWDERILAMVNTQRFRAYDERWVEGHEGELARAESERDALAGALREIALAAERESASRLRGIALAVARSALTANPQASDG